DQRVDSPRRILVDLPNLLQDFLPARIFKVSKPEALVELSITGRAEVRTEDDALATTDIGEMDESRVGPRLKKAGRSRRAAGRPGTAALRVIAPRSLPDEHGSRQQQGSEEQRKAGRQRVHLPLGRAGCSGINFFL